jgi:hypothetical protein
LIVTRDNRSEITMSNPTPHQESQLLSLGRRLFGLFIGVLVVIFALTNINSGKGGTVFSPGQDSSPSSGSNQPAALGKPTKSSNCVAANGIQDKACTPGAIFTDATAKQICVPGYSSSVRNVSTNTKDQVYANYNITSHFTGEYEVDHLISLQLGGSNDIANLWPELADPHPGFHQKDTVENYLHKQVCDGKMTLVKAQELIANDWHQVYNSMPVSAQSLDAESDCLEGCP